MLRNQLFLNLHLASQTSAPSLRVPRGMAGGANFFSRVVQYVANELLVDRLANNPSFQRFAVRSSKAIEELAQKGDQ